MKKTAIALDTKKLAHFSPDHLVCNARFSRDIDKQQKCK